MNDLVVFWLTPIGVAVLIVGYLFWDKRRVLVEAWDPQTGKTKMKKVTPKKEGIPWTKGPGRDKLVAPRQEFTGTYTGWFLERPMIRINARSGNQMPIFAMDPNHDQEQVARLVHEMQDTARVMPPHEADEGGGGLVAVLSEMSWPELYYDFVDSEAMRQAAAANKPAWQSVQFAIAGAFAIGGVFGYLVKLALGGA